MKKILSSISYKLTIPIVSIVFLIILINLFSKWKALQDTQYQTAVAKANSVVKIIESETKSQSEKALLAASICSDLSSVLWAYTVYNQCKDLDSSAAMVDRKMKSMLRTVELVVGYKPKVHFYIPPAISLYRSWSKKRGDDLSAFRSSVSDINLSHKPIRGIEIDKDGFYIRGISPIRNGKGMYLGAVDVFFPYIDILNQVIDKKVEDYALYLRRDLLKLAENTNKTVSVYDKKNSNTGDYVLIGNSGNFQNNFLIKEDFEKTESEIQYKMVESNVYALVPILNYKEERIGLLSIQVDISESITETNFTLIRFLVMGFVILLVVPSLLMLLTAKIVSKPIKKLSYNIKEIADGKLIDSIEIIATDEIGYIYKAFNTLLDRLKASTQFANEIGKGNLDVAIEDVSKDDILSNSLIRMKNNLLEAKKAEKKQKEEEEKRIWISAGIAKFSDILRQNNKDMKTLSEEIIRNLVDYVGVNQGGLFILNDNDKKNPSLELLSAIAFERKKFLQKSIKLGEGLVGACAVEKESIYITKVPEEYINITSGLGDSNPRTILLVPLKLDDKVYGVIELASFKEFDKHQIEFVEIISESIASTLSAVKINQQTAELLEQSQQQSEELAAQEEEMRQNLEEMQSTQDSLMEASKSEEESISTINSVLTPILKIDLDYNITFINSAGADFSGTNIQDAIGEKCYELFNNPHCQTEECRIARAIKNKTRETGKTTVNNNAILYTGVPVFDEDNQVIGAIEQITDLSSLDQ